MFFFIHLVLVDILIRIHVIQPAYGIHNYNTFIWKFEQTINKHFIAHEGHLKVAVRYGFVIAESDDPIGPEYRSSW